MKNEEKEVKAIEKSISPFVNIAKNISIVSQEDMETASSARNQLKKYSKSVTESKETVTKPLNTALKNFRALFKPLEDKIDASISLLDKAMIAYQTNEKRKADDEAAKIAARIAPGKGNLSMKTAVDKIEAIEKPDNKVGNTSFVTTPMFEIEDITQIPYEYLVPNETMIRTAMKAGTKLPGVRYWTEERPRNSN